MNQESKGNEQQLKKTLGPFMLWGLGVGYVISGNYFGWNLGLGFLAGMSQNIEFIFAPPAIASAIGAYFGIFFPELDALLIGIVAYLIFTGLNIVGLQVAATFELFITIIAVLGLLFFAGVTLPAFRVENLQINALPNGYMGIVPFAIWFFLAIEGVANVAEETINPQKNILKGFGFALLTLVILCVLTFMAAVGVGGWEAIVYPDDSGVASDSPLPLAMGLVTGDNQIYYHLLAFIALFGLVASFNGIILAAGRTTFEFGRVGYAPKAIGAVNKKFKTPVNALIFNMIIGIIALFTGKTGEIITIAVFGAFH